MRSGAEFTRVNRRPADRRPARWRRRRLSALLGALGASAALALAPAAASAEEARSAGSFVDSIGVDTHTSYSDTPYASQFATVRQRLVELGVRHVREDLAPQRPDQYERLNQLAAAGIRSTLILGDPNNGIGGLDALIATLKGNLGGAVEAVEGPNEFDTRGGSGWAAGLAAYQQHLYGAVKSDPALSGLPVLGPSVVRKPNEEALGDISANLDYGNVHPYPNAAPPEQNVPAYLSRAALNSGGKPVIATETGYNTALGSNDELLPVSEAAMATYVPRLYLEYFARGIVRTYDYELLDEWPNPGLADPQASFGLLRNDLSPKPAFSALRNLISILQDPAGGAAGALDYSVGGDRSDLHRVLLRKQDGSYYLALWRADSVWNQASRSDVEVPATRVTLDFDHEVAAAERFMPNASAGSLGPVAASGGRVSVAVGAQVVILRLTMGEALEGTGRLKFWVSRRSVPAGATLAVGGRLPGQALGSQTVSIQRWQPQRETWQVVGRARTSGKGTFKKAIRVSPGRFGRVSRLRLVARRTKPSRAVQIRIRGAAAAPGLEDAVVAG